MFIIVSENSLLCVSCSLCGAFLLRLQFGKMDAAFQMVSQLSSIFRFCCSSIVSAAALCELIAKLHAGMGVGSTLRNVQRDGEMDEEMDSVQDKLGCP